VATIHQARLGVVYARQETTFGTLDNTLGNFFAVPAIIDTPKPVRSQPVEQPGRIIQRLDQREVGVLMPRIETKYPFQTNIETFTTKAASGVAAPKHWFGKMLECGFGAGSVQLSTGTTISGAGATTTVLPLTDASTFRAGGVLGVVNSSGLLEMRKIKSISGNNVTLKMALSGAPADTTVVYGAATYCLHNNPNGAEPVYLESIYAGYDKKDRWQFPTGALESLGFEGLSPGEIPRANWGWQHPSFYRADGTNGTVSLVDTTLAKQTYSDIVLNAIRDADCRLRDVSSSALPSFLHCTKLSAQLNIKWEALRTPGGVLSSTCRGYRRVEVMTDPAVAFTFEVPQENVTTYDDYREAQTQLDFEYQIGTTPSRGGVLLSLPRAYVSEATDPPIGAVSGQSITLYGMDDRESVSAGATADDDALAEAAFTIAFI